MALGKCRECQKEVSDQAMKCPHCGIVRPVIKELFPNGVPKPLVYIGKFLKWASIIFIGLVALLFFLMWLFPSPKKESPAPEKVVEQVETKAQKEARLAECKKDLQCWVDEYRFDASYTCKQIVKENAKYEVEWMDESIFSHEPFSTRMKWEDKEAGKFTLFGDALRLQNGFGAMAKTAYSCTYTPSTTIAEFKVLD